MIDTKPLEVTDFSGGITDYFIDGRPNQAEVMDNLVINTNRKPVTRFGSQLFIEEQLPFGSFRVSNIYFLRDDLLAFIEKECYYDDSGWTELTGPNSGNVFNLGDSDSLSSITRWQDHLFLANDAYSSPQKIYKDNSSDLQVRNAGLPEIPAGFSVSNPSGAGSSYLYAAIFRYEYQVGDRTFVDRGPVFTFGTTVTGGTITSGNGATVTLPTALASVENWDDTNIEIEVYRTQDAGDTFYLLNTVTLGTASFLDEVEDATLALNTTLYTTGGGVSNDTPPACKYVNVVNDIGYYANILEDGETLKFEVRQSKPGDPDSVPASFFAETEQEIIGLSSIYDRPLVFTENYIYRIDNFFDSSGLGGMNLQRIDDEAGLASNNSIVQTHKGIFWAGNVGFYWSDGFRVQKISDNLNATYKTLVSNDERRSRIFGTYIPSTERIYWAVCRNDGSNEPDECFVLDLKWGISSTSVFTTMSGDTYFRPTAIRANDSKLYRGDTRGYILEHDESYFTDPKIDTAVTESDWETRTIIHDYQSCFLDFGSKFYRKFVPRIFVSAANTTNLSLGIASSNDNDEVTGDLKPIRYRSNITWGDELPLWGDEEALWNKSGLIEEWRRFPSGGLRCNYKQIQFTNAQVQLFTSDLLGDVTVDQSALTATLGGSFNWPNDVVDYVIAFENDGYVNEYLVTARTSTMLTFTDPNGTAPADGDYGFIVRGKPRGEVLELNGYVIHWAYLSKSHTPFTATSLGSNPS